MLLRARLLFGGEAPAAGGAGAGAGGGGRAPRRTAGLVVRLGAGARRRGRRGLVSALLELLSAAPGLSIVALGAPGDVAFDASVVVGPLSGAEARLFLRETAATAAGTEEAAAGGGGRSELPPSFGAVGVLRAVAGLGPSPSALLGDGGLGVAASEGDASPRRALKSLLLRCAAPALLLRLARLSSALLRGRGGTFSTFAASVVFNCDCGKALQYLRELQTLGLAHPAEAVSATAATAATAAASPPPPPPSSSSPSPSPASSAASWSLSSLAASVGRDLSEELGSTSGSSSPLATFARIAGAAAATLETSLAFARGGSGGRGGSGAGERSSADPGSRLPTTGGHALASHWISRERSLFSSAALLAKRLCQEAPRAKENSTTEGERILSSVALSSLSMLLWDGGDKLLPGLLGFDLHASLARHVESAAATAAAAAAAASGGEGGGGSSFRAHGARAAWAAGASLCSRGSWKEAREPLLRSLRDSDALPESGERGRHRIVSWIARVEYKVKGVSLFIYFEREKSERASRQGRGRDPTTLTLLETLDFPLLYKQDLGSAADFYARAAARASSGGNSSSSSSASASAAPSSFSPLALEQEAEALEGAAGILRYRGNDADALACYRASLAARAAAAAAAAAAARRSPLSPPVLSLSAASAANNAAVLLVAAGARAASQGDREAARRRYAEAGELYAQVLASREALLGPEDPAVASALFNQAALAARRGLRGEARERLQRAAAVREFALGARSAELAELNAALALWLVAAASGEEGGASPPLASPPPTSLCLSRREARAHARAALAVFEELARRGEAGDAVRARHAARVAQLKGFLGES